MNKKIKVIELLNKIYAKLDVPKRVKLNTDTFEYCEEEQDFYDKEHSTFLICDYAQSHSKWLEVEVEILEDQEEIDIQGINENDFIIKYHSKDIFTTETLDDLFHKIALEIMRNRNKQNEILKAVKQLDKKINK